MSKLVNFAGLVAVILGGVATWIALVPARLASKNGQIWPFLAAGVVALVVAFALAKARKRQRPRLPMSVIVTYTAAAVSITSAALVVWMVVNKTTEIPVTAPVWAGIWGLAAGAAAGLGIALVDRGIARSKK